MTEKTKIIIKKVPFTTMAEKKIKLCESKCGPNFTGQQTVAWERSKCPIKGLADNCRQSSTKTEGKSADLKKTDEKKGETSYKKIQRGGFKYRNWGRLAGGQETRGNLPVL